ncbi:MAG: hypothetical protein JWM99_447 [Verrucomicrobiales bacterium]|nr:hypothetical protein [Verrucomicrobiales bacterium]
MNDITDQQLLKQFAETRAEEAFEEVIRRHVDLVYSAAKRLVVDPHLAEDVTQAVFAVLAEEPAEVMRKLQDGAPLSGWLHLTTRNIAAKTVRTEMRRRAREEKASTMQDLSSTSHDPEWDRIAPQLDHALAQLSENDRNALLLRFFERKTAREIGHSLGLSEEAAQKRVQRALEGLRQIFARRGVAVPATSLAAFLASNVIEASPLALVNTIAKSILIGGVATVSYAPATGTFSKLFTSFVMTKTQTTILIGLTAGFLIPLGHQHLVLNQLRAEASSNPGPTQSPVAGPPSSNAAADEAGKEIEEIATLRRRADELRTAIAARRSLKKAARITERVQAGPVLISNGRQELLKNLVFAGNSTPEAALQSLVALKRDGDLDQISDLIVLPPKDVDEWNASLASSEKRTELVQSLIEDMQGVTISSGWDGKELHEDKIWPKDRDAEAIISIQEKSVIDDRRVQFQVKIVRGAQTRVDTFMFGLTSSGWKEIGI